MALAQDSMRRCCHRRDHGEVCRGIWCSQRCGVRVLGTLPFLLRTLGARTWVPLYSPFLDTTPSAGTGKRVGNRLQSQGGRLFWIQADRLILVLRK